MRAFEKMEFNLVQGIVPQASKSGRRS